MGNDSLALAELLFSWEGLWDLCCLVLGFLTYELPTHLDPPSYYCSELHVLRELGYSLERCTYRCIRTIYVCPLADPADSLVLVLLAWETSCVQKPPDSVSRCLFII